MPWIRAQQLPSWPEAPETPGRVAASAPLARAPQPPLLGALPFVGPVPSPLGGVRFTAAARALPLPASPPASRRAHAGDKFLRRASTPWTPTLVAGRGCCRCCCRCCRRCCICRSITGPQQLARAGACVCGAFVLVGVQRSANCCKMPSCLTKFLKTGADCKNSTTSTPRLQARYLRGDPKERAPGDQHRITPNAHPTAPWPMGLG